MFYGILDHIEEDRLGSSLTVAATVGAASITVDWTVDFGDEGTLTLAGQSYDYDTVDSDLSTIGLVAGETITVAAAVGEEVGVVTSVDEESVVWKAYVLLPDADQAQPVVVPLETRRFYVLGDGQQGTMVPIDVVGDGDMVIAGAPGEAADASHDYDFPDPAEVAVDPPTESPAIISVTGSATALTVYTQPVLPTTLLDYYVNGVLVAADERSTVVNLTTDGTSALADDTTYTITVQAHNSATDADPTLLPPPSAGVTGALNPGMTATQVYAILAAGVIITGILFFGTNGKLSSDGLTITHPDGRQTILRGDGSGNQFVGQAILDAATILGLLAIQGGATVSSDVTLLKGIADPSSKPGVTAAGWDSVAISNGEIGINPRGLFDNGATWVYIDSVYTDGNVNSFNKTTGVRTVVATLPSKFNGAGGIVKIGSSWYVLGHDSNRAGNWYVYIFDAAWTKTGEWLVKDPGNNSNFADHSCALGIDGAGGLLIARRSTSNAFTINPYTVAGVPTAAPGTYPAWAGADITGVYKLAVDTATVRYVATAAASGIRVFNTATAARVPTEEWTPAAGVLGISHDGTYWHSMGTDHVWKYENLIGSYDFAFTWVDNDAGGAGLAETKRSNILTIEPPKRAKWTVSLPSAPPDDHTTDGANTANLYAAPTGNTLVLQTALAEGVLSQTYTSSTLATSGAAPPAVSGFAGRPGAVGRIVSSELDDNGDPVIDVRGDGYSTLARTSNRPIVLRDFAELDFTGATDSATALQAIITDAGPGAQIEWGRPGHLVCHAGLTMPLFQGLKGTGKYMGAGGSPLTVLDFPTLTGSQAGITGGGGNEIEDLIIRGPMTGANATIGFNSPSGSPLFRGVSFYGWTIGSKLTDAYYSRFDDCEWMYNKNAMVHAGCYNLEIIDPKIYCKYGASLASFGAGIVGGARGLTIESGAIEGYGASGGIGLNAGETLAMDGTYFESSDSGSNAFGIIAAAVNQVVLSLRGLVVYLNEHNRFVDMGGATSSVIHSDGNKFVCPTTSGTAPIAYNFATTDVGNIKGHIGRDEWGEVLKAGTQYVPTGVFNLGQLVDLDIRHPSRQYLGGDICGTGSPEGVVPGRVGAVYRRLDGGATTSLYVKTSGTGTTGWTAK